MTIKGLHYTATLILRSLERMRCRNMRQISCPGQIFLLIIQTGTCLYSPYNIQILFTVFFFTKMTNYLQKVLYLS